MDATRREPSTGQVRAKHRDQFAAVNFLTQVSKYDLDRMNLNLKQAKVEKKYRRVLNAKRKKDTLEMTLTQ